MASFSESDPFPPPPLPPVGGPDSVVLGPPPPFPLPPPAPPWPPAAYGGANSLLKFNVVRPSETTSSLKVIFVSFFVGGRPFGKGRLRYIYTTHKRLKILVLFLLR